MQIVKNNQEYEDFVKSYYPTTESFKYPEEYPCIVRARSESFGIMGDAWVFSYIDCKDDFKVKSKDGLNHARKMLDTLKKKWIYLQ
jgi:hypothetical protein